MDDHLNEESSASGCCLAFAGFLNTTFLKILKAGSLLDITNEDFCKGSSKDSNQNFNYLLTSQHTYFTEYSSVIFYSFSICFLIRTVVVNDNLQ